MPKVAFLLLVLWAAQVQADDQAYQQCILQYQSQVEIPEAAALVRNACNHIHRELVVLPRKKAYWQCVLDHISPIKNREVMADLLQVCREQHDFRK